MKRSLSLLLASLMLVSALTACGRRNDTPQDNGQTGTQNESAVVGGETTPNDNHNGTANSNNSTDTNTTQEDHPVMDDLENAGENAVLGAGEVGRAVTDGIRSAGDALTGNSSHSANRTTNTTAYNQKLSNHGTLKQNGNVVTFQNPVLPGIF